MALQQTVNAVDISDSDVVDISAVVPGAVVAGPGGGAPQSQTGTVTLAGFAFPNAKLTLLTDGQVTTTLIANSDGTFQVTINNLNFGNYQFSIYVEDELKNTSSPYAVNVAVFTSAPYSVRNIVLPPTIAANSTVVAAGGQVTIFGYAAPGASVTATVVGGTDLGTAVTDGNGFYRIVATAPQTTGIVSVRSRAVVGSATSAYSRPIQLLLYNPQNPPPDGSNPPPQYATCVDYNKDRRVNLIDFSILLFWFGKDNPPPTVDCNTDRVIDIKDFSMLMYFWTG